MAMTDAGNGRAEHLRGTHSTDRLTEEEAVVVELVDHMMVETDPRTEEVEVTVVEAVEHHLDRQMAGATPAEEVMLMEVDLQAAAEEVGITRDLTRKQYCGKRRDDDN